MGGGKASARHLPRTHDARTQKNSRRWQQCWRQCASGQPRLRARKGARQRRRKREEEESARARALPPDKSDGPAKSPTVPSKMPRNKTSLRPPKFNTVVARSCGGRAAAGGRWAEAARAVPRSRRVASGLHFSPQSRTSCAARRPSSEKQETSACVKQEGKSSVAASPAMRARRGRTRGGRGVDA